MYGLLFSQVCIKLQQWWLYPKVPQKPSATEKKRAARWEPWRTPALESPVLFRQDMEASKKNPQVWRSKESMLNSSRNNHFHLSMCKEREGEGEGRQKAAGCNITTLQHSVATLGKQYYLHRKKYYLHNITSKERPSATSQHRRLLSVGPWESHLSFLRLHVNNGELGILILLPTIDGKIKGDQQMGKYLAYPYL